MQNDIEQFLKLRHGRNGPLQTICARFLTRRPLIMRRLQLRHGECPAKTGVHRSGTIFQTSVQLLVYADDIDIIGSTKRDVNAAFCAIERDCTKMGLAVNKGKTKYMFSTGRDVRRIDFWITADIYAFDTVKEFIWLRRYHQK